MLTDQQLRDAEPPLSGRARILPLGNRLHVEIGRRGKSFHQKYRLKRADGSTDDSSIKLGTFPEMSCAEAITKGAQVRRLVDDGVDPKTRFEMVATLARTRAGMTFEAVAEKWFEYESPRWDEKHAEKMRAAIWKHIIPQIGHYPITDIKPPHCVEALDKVMNTTLSMGGKVRARAAEVFDFAISRGLIDTNPMLSVYRKTPPAMKRLRKKLPAILDMVSLGEIMRRAEALHAEDVNRISPSIYRAHVMTAFTGKRIGEVCKARWDHIDLNAAKWNIPREEMKIKDRERPAHLVPLSKQLVKMLRQWREDTAGDWVFPSLFRDHVLPDGVEKLYRDADRLNLSKRHSPNSWRKCIATHAGNEYDKRHRKVFEEELVKAHLDHKISLDILNRYDLGDRYHARTYLAQWWADRLVKAWQSV